MPNSEGGPSGAPLERALDGLRIGLLSAWTSHLGGGVFEAIVAQANLIRRQGGTAIVFGLADRYSEADSERLAPSPVHALEVLGPGGIGYAPGLTRRLLAENLDCLHLNGIWTYPSRAAVQWTRRTRRPVIISPHGMLDPWILARSPLKKSLARIGYERASWRAARAFHALTEREAQEIDNATGRPADVVIPNSAPEPSPTRSVRPPPQVTYIGRIHPKKNLPALVRAWQIANLPSDSRLTIGGWGSAADVAVLERAVAEVESDVQFVGPVYGQAKRDLLARSRFVILPSLGEGLPMAILEAWAAGVPAIATAECNLAVGFARHAALECNHTPENLAAVLERALRISEPEWLAMSAAAHGLVDERFSPKAVSHQWAKAYTGLIGRSHGPGAAS